VRTSGGRRTCRLVRPSLGLTRTCAGRLKTLVGRGPRLARDRQAQADLRVLRVLLPAGVRRRHAAVEGEQGQGFLDLSRSGKTYIDVLWSRLGEHAHQVGAAGADVSQGSDHGHAGSDGSGDDIGFTTLVGARRRGGSRRYEPGSRDRARGDLHLRPRDGRLRGDLRRHERHVRLGYDDGPDAVFGSRSAEADQHPAVSVLQRSGPAGPHRRRQADDHRARRQPAGHQEGRDHYPRRHRQHRARRPRQVRAPQRLQQPDHRLGSHLDRQLEPRGRRAQQGRRVE
jgi:hypothetical protein